MNGASKPINKIDDGSKKFIIDCLQGDCTHGFDVDSIYFNEGRWYIFEYLKCENPRMTPHTSDPKYYAYNWKKFYSLYQLAKRLNGRLFLVNYSTRATDGDKVKIMEVIDFDYQKALDFEKPPRKTGPYEYMTIRDYLLSRDEYSVWLRRLNKTATLPEPV